MAVSAQNVAAFLGQPGDADIIATATQAIPVVQTMVKAYVRGTGDGWLPEDVSDDLDAVVVTATARLITNPGGLPVEHTAGPFTNSCAVLSPAGRSPNWQCSTGTASAPSRSTRRGDNTAPRTQHSIRSPENGDRMLCVPSFPF